MIRLFVGLLGAAMLGGCITPYPDITQSRSPCRSEPGGWCDFVREAAAESYGYAMLSSNAYQDEDRYTDLPPLFLERENSDNNASGLAYSVFDRHAVSGGERGPLLARIIAFRGTEFGSSSDIFSGSLGDRQRDGARMAYAAERAHLNSENYSDIPIEVTGHSLGGALATQISIDNPGVRAFVFNTSPFFAGDPAMGDADRLAVSERGEFLRVLRRYKAPPAANVLVINCNPSASAGSKHSIRKLADCLTWIAAYNDSYALAAIAPNGIAKPEVECGEADKVHPGMVKPGRTVAGGVAETGHCMHAPKAARQPG
ncbi:lipase family protein [Pontixanthobacter sp.]|uniref:lipase family protein n=1 Tax=Pontixanthobacter sp. TaxID=2792078 RepID=UPI003C7AEB49